MMSHLREKINFFQKHSSNYLQAVMGLQYLDKVMVKETHLHNQGGERRIRNIFCRVI